MLYEGFFAGVTWPKNIVVFSGGRIFRLHPAHRFQASGFRRAKFRAVLRAGFRNLWRIVFAYLVHAHRTKVRKVANGEKLAGRMNPDDSALILRYPRHRISHHLACCFRRCRSNCFRYRGAAKRWRHSGIRFFLRPVSRILPMP